MTYIQTNYNTDYYGWTNCQTSAIVESLAATETTFHYWLEAAEQCKAAAPATGFVAEWGWPVETGALFTLAARLANEVRASVPATLPAAFRKFIWSDLGEVHWMQIAAYYLNIE